MRPKRVGKLRSKRVGKLRPKQLILLLLRRWFPRVCYSFPPDADADADACSMRLPRPHFHPPGNCVSFFDVVLILLQSGTGLAVTWLGLAVTRVPPQFSHQFVPSLRWRPRAVLLLLERCPQMLLRQVCYHRQELTIVALARLRTATCSMSHPRPRFHPPGTRHCAVCEGCC